MNPSISSPTPHYAFTVGFEDILATAYRPRAFYDGTMPAQEFRRSPQFKEAVVETLVGLQWLEQMVGDDPRWHRIRDALASFEARYQSDDSRQVDAQCDFLGNGKRLLFKLCCLLNEDGRPATRERVLRAIDQGLPADAPVPDPTVLLGKAWLAGQDLDPRLLDLTPQRSPVHRLIALIPSDRAGNLRALLSEWLPRSSAAATRAQDGTGELLEVGCRLLAALGDEMNGLSPADREKVFKRMERRLSPGLWEKHVDELAAALVLAESIRAGADNPRLQERLDLLKPWLAKQGVRAGAQEVAEALGLFQRDVVVDTAVDPLSPAARSAAWRMLFPGA
jgi:hypothetical protein